MAAWGSRPPGPGSAAWTRRHGTAFQRLSPRDLDQRALAQIRIPTGAQLAEQARGQLAERRSEAELARELQRVIHVLEAQCRGEHDVRSMIAARDSTDVTDDLRARGLTGAHGINHGVRVETGALGERHA